MPLGEKKKSHGYQIWRFGWPIHMNIQYMENTLSVPLVSVGRGK
jgi:hypothetical protein